MTVTITAADLVRTIDNVLPFTNRDETLPMLCAVFLETADGKLTATATDRYTLGHARADCTGSLPKEGVLIRRADAMLITRLFRPARRRAGHSLMAQVSLTLEPAKGGDNKILRVATADTLGLVRELGIGISTMDVQFVGYRGLINKLESPAENQPVGLNPQYLARFARVAAEYSGEPLRFFSGGPASGSIIEIGENFLGLIMAVRCADGVQRRFQIVEPEKATPAKAQAAAKPRVRAKAPAAKATPKRTRKSTAA